MRLVEKGVFVMGDRGNFYSPSFFESLSGGSSIDTTLVELTSDFYILDHVITCEEWDAVMGTQTAGLGTLPKVNVSWHDANTFITRLNDLTGQIYRLPTEAEWEFAARGGIYDNGGIFSGSNHALDSAGWYSGNSGNQIHPVKQKDPNALHLYDMSGNIWEWCLDYYHDSYVQGAKKSFFSKERYPIQNPTGPAVGNKRVLRGGSFCDKDYHCWVFFRNKLNPQRMNGKTGFRIVIGV